MTAAGGDMSLEARRIVSVYADRDHDPRLDYSLDDPVNRFWYRTRCAMVLRGLRHHRVTPLNDKAVLDVGCGTGSWLSTFERWGVERGRLAGIDLSADRVAAARALLSDNSRAASADIKTGDASVLAWADATFDIVSQNTIFSSILHAGMRQRVAQEMLRVLKPGGLVLWYDLFAPNPLNPNVRPVRQSDIRSLFSGCNVQLARISLAPPITRTLLPGAPTLAACLERARILNSHYLAFIRK